MDAIATCIESLKKEMADLEVRHEHLLSGVIGSSRFKDYTLISAIWLDIYPLCSFISFPCVYFFPSLLYRVHLISLALMTYFAKLDMTYTFLGL